LTAPSTTRAGILYGLAAFVAWGLAPLYWKALIGVPAQETLAHRVVWSLPCLALFLGTGRRWSELWRTVRTPRVLLTLACTTLLIGLNWYLFVFAINENRILEASLGYFINPLVNVVLGLVVLRERLRPAQGFAVGLAALGVLILTVRFGHVPWLALALAVSFGFYGLLRKTVGADALVGLTVEVAFLFPIALGYLVREAWLGQGHFSFGVPSPTLLLVAAGPVTVLPLLWFTHAARRLRYTAIGVLQYLAPTGQFLLATTLYREPFTPAHLAAFGCIWAALAIYTTVSISGRGLRVLLRDRSPTELEGETTHDSTHVPTGRDHARPGGSLRPRDPR
jgi:chloramphenicol-sensitive protein RarD